MPDLLCACPRVVDPRSLVCPHAGPNRRLSIFCGGYRDAVVPLEPGGDCRCGRSRCG